MQSPHGFRCAAVLQIPWSVFEQVGAQLSPRPWIFLKKASVAAVHGTICAFIIKRPSAPATGNSSKHPLKGASKTEVRLGHKNMVPCKYAEMIFKQVRPFQKL